MPGEVVIERGISPRSRLQAVVKIQNNFIQRQLVNQEHASGTDIFEFFLRAALLFEQFQDFAEEFLAGNDGRVNDRLFDLLNLGWVRKFRRIIDLEHSPVDRRDLISETGRGGDEVDLKFALEALLHDFKVQQSQESAAKAESERH